MIVNNQKRDISNVQKQLEKEACDKENKPFIIGEFNNEKSLSRKVLI